MAAEKEKGKKRLIEDPLEKCTARVSIVVVSLFFLPRTTRLCTVTTRVMMV
jgi:hypothetical protein